MPLFPLKDDEVHVWTAPTDDEEMVRACESVLVDHEVERAARFPRVEDHRRSIVSLGIRRLLLSTYLDQPTHSLEFDEGPNGKPMLRDATMELNFSLSHSRDLVIFALSRRRGVGIDVQKVRASRDLSALEQRVLSPRERETLNRLPPEDRAANFYRCWVRKEALLKLIGTGLHDVALDAFDAEDRAQSCTLAELHVPAGYVGAVAVDGRRSAIHELGAVRSTACLSSNQERKHRLLR